MSAPCSHLDNLPLPPMPQGGCEECIAEDDSWVHLRYCTAWGATRCCDSSKNRHARKRWEATGHGVVRSKEPGEFWAFCFVDDEMVGTTIN
jgi:hypothetical protein